MTVHFKTNHEEGEYTCSICSEIFTIKKYLNYHLKHHKKEQERGENWIKPSLRLPKLQCDKCETILSGEYNLKEHKKHWHTPGKYNCSQCEMSFEFKGNLRTHKGKLHQNDPELFKVKMKAHSQRLTEKRRQLGKFLCAHCGQYLQKRNMSSNKFNRFHKIGQKGMPTRREYMEHKINISS